MYFVYILKSLNFNKSYVGITDNLEKRFKEHNNGRSFYTRIYKPWKVIYVEKVKGIHEERERELFFKSRSGRRFMKEKIFSK